MTQDLSTAEIPFEDGAVQFRYSRYLADDGSRWIRHGLFVAYHPNGMVASEGAYEHGAEQGLWRDFHDDGSLAAKGEYQDGVEVGDWAYFEPGQVKD